MIIGVFNFLTHRIAVPTDGRINLKGLAKFVLSSSTAKHSHFRLSSRRHVSHRALSPSSAMACKLSCQKTPPFGCAWTNPGDSSTPSWRQGKASMGSVPASVEVARLFPLLLLLAFVFVLLT